MNNYIDWVKEALQLCISSEEQEDFLRLQRSFANFSTKEKKEIENTLLSVLEPNDAVYVFSKLSRFMDDSDIRKGLFQAVSRGEYDFYDAGMIELQICCMEGFYREKRIFHRKNIERYRKAVGGYRAYHPIPSRNRKRIAIIVEQILRWQHSPTQVIMNFAYMLQERMGYEVVLFACPCNWAIAETLWYHPLFSSYIKSDDSLNVTIMYRDAEFQAYQMNLSPLGQDQYAKMLDYIYQWNPLFVFNLGTCNPVADLAADFTTVVAKDMGQTCPISEGDVLMRIGECGEELEEEYREALGANQTQIFMNRTMPVLLEKSDRCISREELGLPEDKFLVALVGNRLDQEIDEKFAQFMKGLLDQRDELAFVIIGKVDVVREMFSAEMANGRVFFLGYCEDLIATYNAVDLYLNPIRSGGGYSSVMALTAGVPVVTLRGGDVAYQVGEEFVVRDIDEIEKVIWRYMDDAEFYKAQKAAAENVAQKNSVDKLEQYVREFMDKILKCMGDGTGE